MNGKASPAGSAALIKRIVQGQRATYYCPKCQKV